jgi:glycosyltransferase involved in cell wall biosynthesis
MIIGIDIRAAVGKKAGKGWMIYYLVEALTNLPAAGSHQFILYTDKKTDFDFVLPKNFSIRLVPQRGLWWHWQVARELKKSDEVQIYLSPASYIVPALVKDKCVLIVHDLVSRIFPQGHNKKAVLIERVTLRLALKKALQVTAISKNTERDLLKYYPFVKGKTGVAYLAAGPNYRTVADRHRLDQVRRTYRLPEKFIMFVGTIEPRKNIKRIIQALAEIKDQKIHLVVVGGRGWQWQDIVDEVERLGLQSRVLFVGYVAPEDLIAFYSLASVFAFPSLYEGFGLPVLEAMQAGCPVVTGKISSLPEVAGAAAILVDPQKATAIARGLELAITHRDDLVVAGKEQAQKFSWQKTAQQILNNITDATSRKKTE